MGHTAAFLQVGSVLGPNWHLLGPPCIHYFLLSESPGSPDSADNFEFSAERLSENAKSAKITLFAELLTVISPIYVQSLL